MPDVLTVFVHGYGEIMVERPGVYDESSFSDGVADAVAKVMTLVAPHDGTYFHPVLGWTKREKRDWG